MPEQDLHATHPTQHPQDSVERRSRVLLATDDRDRPCDAFAVRASYPQKMAKLGSSTILRGAAPDCSRQHERCRVIMQRHHLGNVPRSHFPWADIPATDIFSQRSLRRRMWRWEVHHDPDDLL